MAVLRSITNLISTMTGDTTLLSWVQKRDESARRREAVGRTCQRAMQRAGIDPLSSPVLVTDIGLLAYRSARSSPKLVRSVPILDDARYLRPFAEVLVRQKGRHNVRLAIYDGQGRMVFADGYSGVRRGHSRLVTKTWLPLENVSSPNGRWALGLVFGEDIVGWHPFTWEALADNDILNDLRTDGEINDELRNALNKGKFSKMTLDELLVNQEE